MITPPYLIKNDKIKIVAPAGKINKQVVNHAVKVIESWGLHVILGEHLFDDHNQYSATDEKRLKDFQNALDNEEINAILCARGGYGIIRIIDQLDFSGFKKNPKWIIGFSDITILHSHIHTNFNIETLHAAMLKGLFENNTSAETVRKSLFGEPLVYEVETHPLSRPGTAAGILVGGNLAILSSLIGSESDIDTFGKILFVEEIGEYMYRLDRMMWQMKRSGKLEKLTGLIVGGMTDLQDNKDPFGKSAYDIVADAIHEYDYPVIFGFPAGHQNDNRALILGRNCSINVSDTKTTLNFESKTLN